MIFAIKRLSEVLTYKFIKMVNKSRRAFLAHTAGIIGFTFIEPVFNVNSKSMMIRVNLNNQTHNHKVGSLVNAKIISDSLETLWVPITAVVDLGKDKIVWKWNDGHFKAKKIETGIKVNNWIEIADGLTEADQIASEAHFLSDSEGFIKLNDDDDKE